MVGSAIRIDQLRSHTTYLVFCLLVTVALSGCAAVAARPSKGPIAPSMKGYELYSWQTDSTWTFALVLGTNRIKSSDELLGPPGEERGLVWLMEELERLPRGESVFWTSGRVPGTILPPEDVIRTVQSHCARLGLELHVLDSEPPEVSSLHVVPTCSDPDPMASEHLTGRSRAVPLGKSAGRRAVDHPVPTDCVNRVSRGSKWTG